MTLGCLNLEKKLSSSVNKGDVTLKNTHICYRKNIDRNQSALGSYRWVSFFQKSVCRLSPSYVFVCGVYSLLSS